jgi:hypothetical protein
MQNLIRLDWDGFDLRFAIDAQTFHRMLYRSLTMCETIEKNQSGR